MDAGADVCVTSVHKMGSGLEQGSVFHLQGGRIAAQTLKTRADLLATTSPSVLLYAALDGWRRQMVEQGRELLTQALALAAGLRADLEKVEGLHVNDRADFCGPGRAFDMDPLQVFIDLSDLQVTGYDAADWLREHHQINLHVSDHRRISAQLTYADDETTAGRLLAAMQDLAANSDQLRPAPKIDIPDPTELRIEQAMTPREAYFAPLEHVPWRKAVGRVAAETITPYPPGIPAVLPGQRLNNAVLRYLRQGVEAGMVIPDAADASVATVAVTAQP
jgi:arginine/lysine/ornithine decarboxylase